MFPTLLHTPSFETPATWTASVILSSCWQAWNGLSVCSLLGRSSECVRRNKIVKRWGSEVPRENWCEEKWIFQEARRQIQGNTGYFYIFKLPVIFCNIMILEKSERNSHIWLLAFHQIFTGSSGADSKTWLGTNAGSHQYFCIEVHKDFRKHAVGRT